MWRTTGLTLLELMIVLTLAAVTAGLGIPAFTGVIADARRTAAVNDLIASVQLARSTAIRRNRQAVLCPLGSRPCSDDADWSKGWMVFVNEDRRRPPQLDPGETVLHQRGPVGQVKINANRDHFAFHRIGLRSTNGTLVVCSGNPPRRARAVIVSYTGRPRVAKQNADGTPLRC